MAEDPLTLSICVRCRDGREDPRSDIRGGQRLADTITTLVARNGLPAPGMHLRGVRCMSQCKRPCTIALSGPDRFTLLFGDLDPNAHAQDVLQLATLYADAPQGFLPRDQRPAPLQASILGRIPPLGYVGELSHSLCLSTPSDLETET